MFSLARRAATASLLLLMAAGAADAGSEIAQTVVATGVPRPLEIARDGRSLMVLSPGARGDAAGELYRMPIDEGGPVDLSGYPRLLLPFAGSGLAAFGSLAIHP